MRPFGFGQITLAACLLLTGTTAISQTLLPSVTTPLLPGSEPSKSLNGVKEIIQSKTFDFINTNTGEKKEMQQFCLPAGLKLVQVLEPTTQKSNAQSQLDIKADTATNCIYLNATIPPARKTCITNVFQSQCSDALPTTLGVTLPYQAVVIDPADLLHKDILGGSSTTATDKALPETSK